MYCRRLDAETYPSAKVVDLAEHMVAVKVNPDRSRRGMALAQHYGVESFPAIFFLDPEGRVVHRVLGFLPPDEFAGEMRQALSQAPGPGAR